MNRPTPQEIAAAVLVPTEPWDRPPESEASNWAMGGTHGGTARAETRVVDGVRWYVRWYVECGGGRWILNVGGDWLESGPAFGTRAAAAAMLRRALRQSQQVRS